MTDQAENSWQPSGFDDDLVDSPIYDIPPYSQRVLTGEEEDDDDDDDSVYVNLAPLKQPSSTIGNNEVPHLPQKVGSREDVDVKLGMKSAPGMESIKPIPAPRRSIQQRRMSRESGSSSRSSIDSAERSIIEENDSSRENNNVLDLREGQESSKSKVEAKPRPVPAPRPSKTGIIELAGVTQSVSLDYLSEEHNSDGEEADSDNEREEYVNMQTWCTNDPLVTPNASVGGALDIPSQTLPGVGVSDMSPGIRPDSIGGEEIEDEDALIAKQNEENARLEASAAGRLTDNQGVSGTSLSDSNERIVIGAEDSVADQRESGDYDDIQSLRLQAQDYDGQDDYMSVWKMSSGMGPVAKVESGPVVQRPPSDLITFANSSRNDDIEQYSEGHPRSRDSILSFCAPHPNFDPPPLPVHVHSRDLHVTSSPIYQNETPPAVPPRPKQPFHGQGGASSSSVTNTRPDRDSFEDFVTLRTKEGVCPPPTIPEMLPAASGHAAQHTEEDIYSPDPTQFSPAPPLPPPVKPHHMSQLVHDSSFIYELEQPSPGSHMDKSFTYDQNLVWESDDTLSDGGDFVGDILDLSFELRKPRHAESSIPIVPAAPSSITERKGHLFKNSSNNSGRRGWRKRWVTFDGQELKYFSDVKSVVSKRVIPVMTMVNVEQHIKHAEIHAFQFKLFSIDRVYTFAANDANDLALWTSVLMSSILSKEEQFVEGGHMHSPDKKGEVRMEGVKGMKYMVIKKDKMAYYNTENDFRAGCPIAVIDMKLASIKDLGRHKLQMITNFATYNLLFDTMDSLISWRQGLESAIAEGLADDQVLKQVYENFSNRFCADCGAPDPHWASINLAVTLCQNCAGIHRMLSCPISKIRSLRMDQKVWSPSLIQLMKQVGNDNANKFWEWNTSTDDRIDSDADMVCRREFVLAKYQEMRFIRYHPLHTDQEALNQALCKSVQYNDVLETLQLFFSGADIHSKSSSHGTKGDSPLQLAQKAQQTLQMEFLQQNGGENQSDQSFSLTSTVTRMDSRHLCSIRHRGYLFKTGSNLKEFLRRWCVLEHGTLSYYENDKGAVPKDHIEKREMLSITCTSVPEEKYQHSFELATKKYGGRVYLFAADSADEREKWMLNLAKNFTCIPARLHEHLKDIYKGGNVYVRHGATKEWHKRWMHMKGRNLFVYKEDERGGFEEIDLRKVISIKELQLTERCLETFDEGPPFVIDLPNKAVYIQGDIRKETDTWQTTLQKVVLEGGGMHLVDQPLTSDEVPVTVDKCLNFVSTHGLKQEGIYRLNGQHSKVTSLLEEFHNNARAVHLQLGDHQVHDVATVLKRFFRGLEDPLLTNALYQKWIETTELQDLPSKMQWYKYLLEDLPPVHKSTLKRLIGHLALVAEYEVDNKMNIKNIGSIFGPALMSGDKKQLPNAVGYGNTNQEIGVVMDLLKHHRSLFEGREEELVQEQKIQEALKRIEMAQSHVRMSVNQPGDLLLGVYINNMDGDVVTTKVPPYMTAEELLDFVISKSQLSDPSTWGLYEVICGGQLERAIHFTEKVLEVTLRWSSWPEEFSKNNYLCVKPNTMYEKVESVFDPHYSLFTELQYSERKGFKKFYFDFSQFKLSYHKDTRVSTPLGSWRVEDLTVYLGVESKRSPRTKHGFTFLSSKDKVAKNKDSPFFGHSICCTSAEELYRWIAAILHAQHPEGLTPGSGPLSGAAAGQDMGMPHAEVQASGGRTDSPARLTKHKQSFIHRLINKR